MRTENLAIVFIDIAGFTPRTSRQTREENLRMLQRFDGIMRPLVRAYDGRVIKTIGDAYLLTFRSPTNSLLCSMAVLDRIAETDREIAPEDRFSVRAAVNTGEVRVDAGDIFGEAVNIASRIEGKAAGGEIYFSESAYLSMTKSEVPCEEVGTFELKGIAAPVRIYRIPHVADAALPFGGRGLDRVRGQLGRIHPAQVIVPAVEQARDLIGRTPGLLNKAYAESLRGYEWWRVEVKRNRAVQYGTVIIVAVVILVCLWLYQRKPSTPWQKFQRGLGF